jgi:Ca2+-binding EF-hand superfamily protein
LSDPFLEGNTMKTIPSLVAILFGFVIGANCALAEGEKCDSTKHKHAEGEKCDLPGHDQKHAVSHAEGEKCDSPKHDRKHRRMGGDILGSADSNHDGAVSKKEFNAYYTKHNSKHFKELDTNRDGKLTADELQGSVPKPVAPPSSGGTSHLDNRFAAADVNHDGGLDAEEAVNMPMLSKYYSEVDSNKDGKVTRQEYFDAMPILHGAKNVPMGGASQSM